MSSLDSLKIFKLIYYESNALLNIYLKCLKTYKTQQLRSMFLFCKYL